MAGARVIGETLLPREQPPGQLQTRATGLPPDLLAQAARRLRILSLQYALIFFVSDPLMALLFPDQRAAFVESPLRWLPSVISIASALTLAALTRSRRIPVTTLLDLGLAFEVIGSFGIAAAQYLHPSRYVEGPPWLGLSSIR